MQVDAAAGECARPTLQQELDAIFCVQPRLDIDPDESLGMDEFTWDADSSTTIEFSSASAGDSGSRRLQRNDSTITVNSDLPDVFTCAAELASEVGDSTAGSVLPDVKGIAVELGSEVLVRMALRTILCLPRELAIKVAKKYQGQGTERVSTTFSCSDAVMEAKCSIVIAAKLLLGEMQNPCSDCNYTIDQVVAAEIEQFKADYLVHKTLNSFHRLHCVTRDCCILIVL